MGSVCAKTNKSPKLVPRRSSVVHLSSASLDEDWQASEASIELQFHHSLLRKLQPQSPLTVAELRQAFEKEYARLMRTQCPEACLYKLKAKEIYYQFINDKNSYDYYTKLKRKLVSQMIQGSFTPEETLTEYKNLAKGSFAMHGLEEMYTLTKVYQQSPEKVEGVLQEQKESNLTMLSEQLAQLQGMFTSEDSEFLGLLALSPVRPSAVSQQEPASPQVQRFESRKLLLRQSMTLKQ